MAKVVIKKKAHKDRVGYKRPPKAHQFKPGQSGNPKGRPKGLPTIQEVMAKEAAKLVKVKQGDEVVSVPKIVALVRRIFAKALDGDLGAIRLVTQTIAEPLAADVSTVEDLGLPDDEVIQRMLKRFDHLSSPKGSAK